MSKCENKVHNLLGLKLRMNLAEVHHLYIGIALVSLSLLMPTWGGLITAFIGVWLIIDDIWQHVQQYERFNPCYHSPVHRFIYDYLKLYDRKWFRILNKAADWLFGLFK